jgi:hypothetical protein
MSPLVQFKIVVLFALSVIAVTVIFNFLWRGFAVHHADNPAVQGLNAVLN